MHPGKAGVLACVALAGATLAPGSGAGPGAGAPLAAPAVVRQVRLRPVDLSGPLPDDLRSPEGKTRWDLTGLRLGEAFTRSLADADDGVAVVDRTETGQRDRVYTGDGARAWLFPDRFPDLMKMGGRAEIDLRDEADGRADNMHVDIETVGIGWVHLPSGPREVVLQRARVFRGRARTFIKEAREKITDADPKEARAATMQAISTLDRAAAKGVLHKNNAARRKSRLMKKLADLEKQSS